MSNLTLSEIDEEVARQERAHPVEMICVCGHEWVTDCLDGVLDEDSCEMCGAPGVRDE